jgi:hypothetical protein
LTLAILFASGCGDGSMPASQPPPPVTTPTLTCDASLTAAMVSYTVTALDQLQIGGLDLTRLTHGASGRPIYGEWRMPPNLLGLVALDSRMDIEPTTITLTAHCAGAGKTATAMVVSPVTVTDTQVTILDNEKDTETLR